MMRWPWQEPKPEAGISTKTSKEKMKVGNKELECEVIETFKDDKLLTKQWYSDDIPVSGLVKSFNARTKEELVLTRYGRGK